MKGSVLTRNTMELYDEGLSVLVKNMGIVRAEQFISVLSREGFDYTKWHQKIADEMTCEEFSRIVEESETANPFNGNATII